MKPTESRWALGNWQLAILLAFSLQPLALFASSSPFLIPYQGRLTNPQGVPYTNGQYTIAFTLYDQPVGGSVIWGPETHYKVGVINGMVNVFLGSISTLTNVDFSQTRHLGITIYADNNPNNPAPEMVPRQMIIPAFWAKYSENSGKLAGYDWSSILVGGGNNPVIGQVAGTKIQTGGITSQQLATSAVTASQLAPGAVTRSAIANGAIGSQQITNGAVGTQQIAVGGIQTSNLTDGLVTLQKLFPRQVGTNVATGGLAVSSSCGVSVPRLQGSSSASFQDISNLNVTIQTTGRPVLAFLAPAIIQTSPVTPINTPTAGLTLVGIPGSSQVGMLQLVRNSSQAFIDTVFSTSSGNGATLNYPTPLGFFLDFPPAGTNTYKMQWGFISNPGTSYADIYNVVLVVIEL